MDDSNKKIINKKFKATQSKSEVSDTESDGTDSGHAQQKPHPQNGQFYHKPSYLFMKKLKKDYKRLALIYNSVIQAEQERERRNIDEILHLKKVCHQMQNEFIRIKRKNWCRFCEREAIFISSDGKKFYCSPECEQKQIEFVSVIDNSFKTS